MTLPTEPTAVSAPVPLGSAPIASAGRLVDSFGRLHDNLRISVTDRCNIRCFYCMPAGDVQFLPEANLLRFDQIRRVVEVAAAAGVRKIRLTGGEPLLRRRLPHLIEQLSSVPGVDDLALTTNGMLLQNVAASLHAAGLRRINISLDTLREATFQKISRRSGLDRVLAGIDAALSTGFDSVRLNALAIKGLTEAELIPLVHFAREKNLVIRFIEFMPLDADRRWKSDDVLSGAALRARLEETFGRLLAQPREHPSQPAQHFDFSDGRGGVGFITPVSEPFCGACNRLRLTAEGRLRNCLFSTEEWNVRPLLDAGAANDDLLALIRSCLAAKRPGHLIEQQGFEQPERPMYSIGG